MKKRNIGMALSYAYTACNMLIGLFMSSFLLKQLGDVEYGLYQSISSFVMYLVLLEFGTSSVMSRNVAIANTRGDKIYLRKSITTVFIMNIVLAVIICLVALLFYINIGWIYSKTMTASQIVYARRIFLWIVGCLICSFFLQSLNGLLLGMENYEFGQLLNIAMLFLRTILLMVVILSFKFSVCIAVVDFGIAFISLVVSFLYCKVNYKIVFRISDFSKNIFKESIPLCLAMVIQSFVNQANNSVDKFIISIQMSLEAVALYSVAQYVYSVFSSVTTIPISMYLPQTAKDIGEQYDGNLITHTLIPASRLISFLGGAILFGFITCGKQFITIVYGETKTMAWTYAVIIMVPMLLNMITGPIINVLDVLNKRQVRSYALLVTTVLNIIMTVVLIKICGILGAVIATAVATILGQVMIMNIYYIKYLKIDIWHLYVASMKGNIPFQIISSIICYIIGLKISNIYASLLISGILFVVMSCSLSYKFGLTQDEKKIVKTKVRSYVLRKA